MRYEEALGYELGVGWCGCRSVVNKRIKVYEWLQVVVSWFEVDKVATTTMGKRVDPCHLPRYKLHWAIHGYRPGHEQDDKNSRSQDGSLWNEVRATTRRTTATMM